MRIWHLPVLAIWCLIGSSSWMVAPLVKASLSLIYQVVFFYVISISFSRVKIFNNLMYFTIRDIKALSDKKLQFFKF